MQFPWDSPTQLEQADTSLYARHSWLLPSCSQVAPKVVEVVAVVDVVVELDVVEVDVVEVVDAGAVVVVELVVVVVDEVLVVVVVVVEVVVVVVVPETHWLFSHTLPGSQSPQLMRVPHPLSTEPHCALSAGQSFSVQHCPNLSAGRIRTQSLLLQLLFTWHVAPSRLPRASALKAKTSVTAASDTAAIHLLSFIVPP